MSSLGSPGTPTTPSAQRVGRSGWRDPRLWIGVALVVASAIAGARLLGGADDTARVWAMAHETGPGAPLSADDVVVRRVHFADDSDLALYFSADDDPPTGMVLDRVVGAGELLARSAVTEAGASDLVRVSVQVDPGRVDPGVHAGSVVDVYLDDQAAPTGGKDLDGKALSGVTVLAAPGYADSFAVDGTRQIVLAVPASMVEVYERRIAAMQQPTVDLAVH
ncbi:hypothetical protein [Nocardioides montaniterrae]